MGMGALTRAAQALGILTRDSGSEMLPSITPPAVRPASADPLGLDAIYRAVQLLQTAASQLTMDVWRGPARIATPSWVATPDPWSHGPAFLDETVSSLALRGNAYWRVQRAPDGGIFALEVLDPTDVMIEVPASGPNVYHVGGAGLLPRDIAHLALLRRPGRRTPYGLGPIQACRETVTGAARIRQWADQWLDQASIPNGVLTSDQPLTTADATTLKNRFLASVKATEPVVLGQGTTYKPLLLTPNEMQWLDTQNFNVVAIARLFGIPPRLMLAAIEGTSQTYANQSQEELSFVRWTVMAYLREIEAAVTWLLPRSQTARFNLDAILRADTKTRYESHQIGITAGFLTVPEVRTIEGLPPITTPAQEAPTNA